VIHFLSAIIRRAGRERKVTEVTGVLPSGVSNGGSGQAGLEYTDELSRQYRPKLPR
jgi:hypothetical protein